jgi:hypothetical protein
MMTRRCDNFQRTYFKYLMIGLLAVAGFTGCSLDDVFTNVDGSAIIRVYNQDNYAYWVHLYLVTDDTLVASKHVDSYSSSSSDTNSFEDVDPDYYYLTITKESATAESGRSGTFHIEENEELSFMIEEDGDIKNYN